MTPSIKDIAAACGVSDVTVSRVLNAKENEGIIQIGEETKLRVLSVAQKMGYRPNRLARNLARGTSQSLGFITAMPNDALAASIMAGIRDVCKENDYVLTLCPGAHLQTDPLVSASDLLAQQGADVILVESRVPITRQAEFREALVRCARPVVFINQDIPDAHCVFTNDAAGARTVTEYLISLGHRRIGFACPDPSFGGQKRLQGYMDALRDAGIDIDNRLVIDGEFSEQCGQLAGRELMSLPSPPTAIFGSSDSVAVGVMRELMARSMRIPEDMSLIGYSDQGWIDLLGLSTVRQPAYEMGVEAAKLALQLISNQNYRPMRRCLQTELIMRTSCARART